jgi:hypothetical protein
MGCRLQKVSIRRTTRVLGEAFDAARQKVDGASQIVYVAISARIIVAAHKGERDPRLRNAGLAGLEYEPGSPPLAT